MNANEAFQFLRKGGILPKQPVSKAVLLGRAVQKLSEMGCTVSRSEKSLRGFVLVHSEGDLHDRLDRIGHLLANLGDGCLWDEEEGDNLWRIDFHGSIQD